MLMIRLGRQIQDVPDHPVSPRLGFEPGLSQQEYLDRGRGVWKIDFDRALTHDKIAVVSPVDDTVLAVGTITGAAKYGRRIALEATLLQDDKAVGSTVSWPSRNPVRYVTP